MKNALYSLIIFVILLLTGCADAGEDQHVFSGEVVTLNASNSTPDLNGQIVQYEWKQLNLKTSSVASLSDRFAITPTFTAPDVTTLTELVFKLKTEEHYACRQSGTTQKCRKNVTYDVVSVFLEPSEEDSDPTTFSVHGFISDFNDTPIINAQVQIGTQNTITDANGLYRLDAIAPAEHIAVNITHPDYFANSRIIAVSNSDVSLDMKLGSANTTHTFSALTGATLSDRRRGASVVLPANGYVDINGNPYSGDVTAKMSYYDITTRSGRAAFPGSFEALEGSEVFPIKSFGFMNIELSDSHGEALNLAVGKKAKLTISIIIDLSTPLEEPTWWYTGNALELPSTIALWYYDMNKGYWIEEGETKGSIYTSYSGEVSHLTTWSLAIKGAPAQLSGCVEDTNATRIEDAQIQLSYLNWDSRIISSKTNGMFSIDTILAQKDLTLSATKKIGNSWFYGEYPESIRLKEREKQTLSQCIVLQETALPNGTITVRGNIIASDSFIAKGSISSGTVHLSEGTISGIKELAQADINSDGSFNITFQTTDNLLYILSATGPYYDQQLGIDLPFLGQEVFQLHESKTTYDVNVGVISAI